MNIELFQVDTPIQVFFRFSAHLFELVQVPRVLSERSVVRSADEVLKCSGQSIRDLIFGTGTMFDFYVMGQ